jgi:hypothetical protein
MYVIVAKYLIPKGIRGITIFPFILIGVASDKRNAILINHEKIHIRQQIELLILPFYIWYLFDFGIQFIKYKDKNKAYRNICFEREAYANELNLNYLAKRDCWNFLKYTS